MSAEMKPEFARLFEEAEYVWFTTVRDDGMPQPTPVWFIWENGTFLIYTTPDAQKLDNIRANHKVAVSYAPDVDAATYAVAMGEAAIDPNAPAPMDNSTYIQKYTQSIQDINMSPESFSERFTVAIRVTPTRVRGE